MKHVSKYLDKKTHSTSAPTFSAEEVAKVNAVFARLKLVYPGKYDLTFKTQEHEKLTKREWSQQILKLTLEQLDMGFEKLKKSDVDWPDIKTLVSLSQPEKRDPAHTIYQLPKLRNHSKQVANESLEKLKDIMGGKA